MQHRQLVDLVALYGGMKNDRYRAEQVINATIKVLAAGLDEHGRKILVDRLDGQEREVAKQSTGGRIEITPEVLYQSIAQQEDVERGFAKEHVQATCTALAELLDPADRAQLKARLGERIGALLIPRRELRGPIAQPSGHHHSDPEGRGRTLAAGRPGSRHPLSEAKHSGAHTHSVARSQNPRRDTKVSSTSGSSARREKRTLAEGKPGSERPLSETKD
jgi:hypothetical protein